MILQAYFSSRLLSRDHSGLDPTPFFQQSRLPYIHFNTLSWHMWSLKVNSFGTAVSREGTSRLHALNEAQYRCLGESKLYVSPICLGMSFDTVLHTQALQFKSRKLDNDTIVDKARH